MKLADLLGRGRVIVPLQAQSLPAAVDELAAACAAAGLVDDPARLEAALRAARPEDAVSMGPNAFLPHVRTEAVSGVVVALGVTGAPITVEGRKSRIVLLVAAPPRQAAAYLQAVAAFARLFSRPEVLEALHGAGSAEDVLALPALHELSLDGPLLVRDIMTPRVLSVTPDTPLGEAATLLVHHGVESLPVVGEHGEVIGLLSNRELIKWLVPSYVARVNTGEVPAARMVGDRVIADPRQLPVREAMQRAVLCLSDHHTVSEAATLMANKDVDRVPVVREGKLCGFLTRSDIVRKLIGNG
ncbi:MAG: CBS domain-containing protein [Gemmatimonadota bacterium]